MVVLGIIVLAVVFVLGIFITAVTDSYTNEDAKFFGVMMILVSFAISVGWSIGQDVDCVLVEVDCEVVRTSRMTIVDDGKNTHEYTSHVDVTSINDSTTFYLEHTTNMWGVEDIEAFSYKNK